MDGNGGPPGMAAATPNDAWLAQLLAHADGAGYRRMGRPLPTHFSVQGDKARGIVGARAAVQHAVVQASKVTSLAASTFMGLEGRWLLLPPRLWLHPGCASDAPPATWRDFSLACVVSVITDEDAPDDPMLELHVDPHTVPPGRLHGALGLVSRRELLSHACEWAGGAWDAASRDARRELAPPDRPALMPAMWDPNKHLTALGTDDDAHTPDGWVTAHEEDEETVERAIAAAQAAAEEEETERAAAARGAGALAAAPAAAAPAVGLTAAASQAPLASDAPPTVDEAVAAMAARHALADALLTAKCIDHIIMNPMARGKCRAVRLGARHAGSDNYHLSITATYALRRARAVVRPVRRSRDYRRIQPYYDAEGRRHEPWPALSRDLDDALGQLRLATAGSTPYERAAALATHAQVAADALLPEALARARKQRAAAAAIATAAPAAALAGDASGAPQQPAKPKTPAPRLSKYQAMQRHVDDWTEVTAVLAADHAAARAAAAAEDTRARAQGRTPLRHPTYDVATFMARPPPIFRHVFSKKRAGEWAAIKALWAPALETGGTLPDPLDRAARAVVLARRRRAELELVLSEETARLVAFTRGMELRTALGAGRNFAAAAWGVLSKTAHGDPAGRGPDTPLASLRDGDTLIPPGPRYGPALVRQVEDKWAWKHTCLPALMYAVRATDFGSQALPSDPDPFTWVTRWFTLTNLRKQMRKLRPDLAASHEGPHLYPLARASEQVLRLFLGDLEAAVRQGERHASFYK